MSKIQRLIPGPGRILVKPMPTDERVDVGGGKHLWVIGSTKDEGIFATVIANHGQPYLDDGEIQTVSYTPGTIVLIGKYSGTRVSIGREEHIIIQESTVIAEFREEESDESLDPRA